MKLNEITNQHAEIEAILAELDIQKYPIRSDGTVDVLGNVILSGMNFSELPVQFGNVSGTFDCSECTNLKSLSGSPLTVGSSFYCGDCPNLISLEGGPEAVGSFFNCTGCHLLVSLEGGPIRVGNNFSCCECLELTTLKGAPAFVDGSFYCDACPKMQSLIDYPPSISASFECDWSEIRNGGIGLLLSGCKRFYRPTGAGRIIEKYLGRPEDIFECQAELIEAGYETYAQL